MHEIFNQNAKRVQKEGNSHIIRAKQEVTAVTLESLGRIMFPIVAA